MREDLNLYETVREELLCRLRGKLPLPADELASLADENAYYVTLRACRKGQDWREVLPEYAERAVNDFPGWRTAEQRERDLLRRELRAAGGPLLDVGAGFGRLAPLYRELSLPAVCCEPHALGARLMRRAGVELAVQAAGEALPFRSGIFRTALVTWVLHHDTENVDAARVLSETARALAPGGRLLVVEPLDVDFSLRRLEELLRAAGFVVERVVRFWEERGEDGKARDQTLVAARKS